MTRRFFPEFAAPLTPCNRAVHRSAAVSPESASRRILIVRTIANGDILMGTPLLAALRRAWPDAHLTWMVERREREAIDANPFVDEILLWDSSFWHKMTRRGLYPLWMVHALRLRKRIAAKQYDTLISFQPEDWPMLTRILGKAECIGVFDTFREYHGRTRTSRRSRLFDHVFTFDDHPTHRVDQYLLPLQALGIPLPGPAEKRLIMGFTERDQQQADHFIRQELAGKPFVVVAPLTGWPSRTWPVERFAAVSDDLVQKTGHEIVLVSGGGDKDRAVVEQVAALMHRRPHLATGTFGLRALAALISRAALVVSGDTAPMHLASAFDTPYVALFGPSPVSRFAPLVGRGLPMAEPVPCGPCHKFRCPNQGDDHQRCLKLLTPGAVFAAAQDFLSPTRSAAATVTPAPEGALSK